MTSEEHTALTAKVELMLRRAGWSAGNSVEQVANLVGAATHQALEAGELSLQEIAFMFGQCAALVQFYVQSDPGIQGPDPTAVESAN